EQQKSAAKPDKEKAKPDAAAQKERQKQIRDLRSEVGKLEQAVVDLEAKQAELTDATEDPSTYEEAGKAQHLNRELTALSDQLHAANTDWERATERLLALEAEGE